MKVTRLIGCCSTLTIVVACAAGASAQTMTVANPAAAVQPAEAESTGNIVVTGSRITRNGANAPTPVSVVTSQEIAKAAPTNIADYVNQLPALFGSNSPRNANTIIGGGLAGANILNLRDLGTARTLTLFNGRRITPSFLTGAADINSLPSALIKRVDIVTGGASAAWGSDAVSGVANFVLDDKFTGVKGSAQGGETTHGDAAQWSADLSFGSDFAGGRGHIILSGNYAKTKTAYAGDRSWFKGYKILNNPAYTATNGQPARLILPNSSIYVDGPGFVATGPLAGLQWGADGHALATPITLAPIVSGTLASGGPTEDVSAQFEMQSPVEQGTGYGNVSYELTDHIKIYGEVTYGKSLSLVTAGTFYKPGTVTISNDNAYLDPSVVTRMATAGVTSFPLNASYLRTGRPHGRNTRELQRYLGGFNADLGGNWSIEGYGQHGVSRIQTLVSNNIQPALFNLAIDAVNRGGQIVCRSSIANPGNGCVPLNPFGTAPLTAAQSAYLLGTGVQNQSIHEDVGSLTVHGDLFSLPAGTVSTAFGAEYRKESAVADADPTSTANLFYVGNYKPFKGSFDVKEAFAEILVPLLKDSAVGDLDLNAAGRVTHYSTSGTVGTWKVGATWKPMQDLTFRATRSRDIRAPNLSDLYLGGFTSITNLSDPAKGGVTVAVPVQTSGNPNLTPEIAATWTAGVVYQPQWLRGFTATVDFFRISISNAIFAPSAVQILSQCAAGTQSACALASRDSAGNLTLIRTVPINQRSELAQGVDLELGYRTAVGNAFSADPASLDLRTMINYADRLDITGSQTNIRRAGEVGTNLGAAQGVPRFRGMATISYDANPISLQLKGRFISASKIEADWGPLDVNINHVPAIFYLDTFVGYSFKVKGAKLQLFGAVDNLFDTDPPIAVSQDNINAVGTGTNTYVYDLLGRTFRVGLRFNF